MKIQLNKLSDEFKLHIDRLVGNFFDDKTLQEFFDSLNTEASRFFFTRDTESNLLRIIENSFNVPSLVKDCILYPKYTNILLTISAYSNYLTDILVSNFGLFYFITDDRFNLDFKNYNDALKKNISQRIRRHKNLAQQINELRMLKKSEILKIAYADFYGMLALSEITQCLSDLAGSILSTLFQLCLEEVKKSRQKRIKIPYSLIALGKLGGRELNYSSDVDLILIYDDSQVIDKFLYHSVLSEAVNLFIKHSQTQTVNSFLYRIDFRLRPYGKNAALAGRISDYLLYYETAAEQWENQMLIKMSFLDGDRNLYNFFYNYLVPIIYPSFNSLSPLRQIQKMKANIERHSNDNNNIKNCKGGIRDIEFSVQALQIINGREFHVLRDGNTLSAIEKLFSLSFLNAKELNILKSAYIFYRRIEHYLQLSNNRQTHSIPTTNIDRLKLISFLNLTEKKFNYLLNKYLRQVNLIFNKTLLIKPNKFDFGTISFKDSIKAKANLDFLSKGFNLEGSKVYDNSLIDSFELIEEKLFNYLNKSNKPDKVLNNFVKMIKTVKLPSFFYAQLNEHNLLNKLLDVCQYSEYFMANFSQYPFLIDLIVSNQVKEYDVQSKNDLPLQAVILVLVLKLTFKFINPKNFSQILRTCIVERINLIILTYNIQFNYFVSVLGSIGIGEISLFSDIDLIFVSEEDAYDESQNVFTEILKDINTFLKPFKADCRLRPEGRNSPLVTTPSAFMKYIKERGQAWEFQFMLKCSFVSGNKRMFNNFIKEFENTFAMVNKINLFAELENIKGRIKQSKMFYSKNINIKYSDGGLIDVEFIIYHLVFKSEKLVYGKSIESVCKVLYNQNKVGELILLSKNYVYLKSSNIYLENLLNFKLTQLEDNEIYIDNMKHFFKDFTANRIQEILAENQIYINKLLA